MALRMMLAQEIANKTLAREITKINSTEKLAHAVS